MSFLSNLQLDRNSFWLGFAAGFLLLFLLGRLRPAFRSLISYAKDRYKAWRAEMDTGVETRHRNDTLQRAQSLHLAEALFSLDEILLEPRLLAPPLTFEPGSPPPYQDITEKLLPYMPDWPAIPVLYGAPTLSLVEAMQNGANLALLGEPGSGKSTALAYLAVQTARQAPDLGSLAGLIPFHFHAGDLSLPPRNPQLPLEPLNDVLDAQASPLTAPRLAKFTASCLQNSTALLLVDGMDELTQAGMQSVCTYLAELVKTYPHTRLVLACDWHTPGLADLHLIPFGIVPWGRQQREDFVRQWGALWQRYFVTKSPDGLSANELPFEILDGWLLSDTAPLSPLELTLKVWSAYAGDSQGPGAQAAIEAYVRRLSSVIPQARPALAALAAQMVSTSRPVMSNREAAAAIAAFEPTPGAAQESPVEAEAGDSSGEPTAGPGDFSSPSTQKERIAAPRVLSALLDSGLLRAQPGGRLRVAHPALLGILAAGAYTQPELVENLLRQPDWLGKRLALQSLAACMDLSNWLDTLAPPPAIDTLQHGLLETSRWLRDMPERLPIRSALLRRLATNLQGVELALELRARSLAAITATGSPQMGILFRQLLENPDEITRRLAALGSGALQDAKATPILENLLSDPSPQVRRAACLALVAIGSQPALEAVAASMLHGDEELRKAAAEALANHPEEGYPVLEEASTMPDLLVRRAAVAGLGRVRQPLVASKWAIEILQKLQLEDSQWVVQNAAEQALEEIIQTNARSPRPMPPLTQTPWLIAYASEMGMGVAPGKPAWDLLFKALQQGNLDQRLAALEVLKRHGKENAILPLYDLYFAGDGDVREAAYQTLWHLSAAGLPLPEPKNFGVA